VAAASSSSSSSSFAHLLHGFLDSIAVPKGWFVAIILANVWKQNAPMMVFLASKNGGD
jgi:hypothetical protein